MTITKTKLLPFIALLAVMPFLIGHGFGSLDGPHCGECYEGTYYFGGAPNAQDPVSPLLPLAHTGYISFYARGELQTKTVSTGPTTAMMSIKLQDKKLKELLLVGESPTESGQLGELWTFNGGDNASDIHFLKLLSPMHNSRTGEFLRILFSINPDHFLEPQTGDIASSNRYVLSADNAAHRWLSIGSHAVIYLNEVPLINTNHDGIDTIAPLSFEAESGDVLRIEIQGDDRLTDLTPFWLHTPAGDGHKLLHNVILRNSNERLAIAFTLP